MSEKFTTAGAISIKHFMPDEKTRSEFDLYRPLDEKGVSAVVSSLLKNSGSASGEVINSLGKMFFNKATEIGATTPLSDYVNDSDERQALIKEFDFKVQQIMYADLSDAERNKQLVELTSAYNQKIGKQNVEYLISKGSVAAKMARTGARGNESQLASGTSTPLMSSNMKGDLIPLVIKRSFAEGMRPAEHIALSYMGRGSTVKAQLSTQLPGALFKKLSPNLFHEVITIVDCGTDNGISLPATDSKSIIGRYTAGGANGSVLIDENEYKNLRSSDTATIKVRSPLTCEAAAGICQHCFGLSATGKLPEIGTNVGVIAAQSVSEVLTQSMLSTKHKTTVGERRGNEYENAANMLNNPKSFIDEATIASNNGVVSDIKETALGAKNVFINEKPHFVPREQDLKVKIGDAVKMGDVLSTGTVNPRRLVELRGMGAGREYMAKELRDIYGGGLDPRHFELIAKNMIKHVQVLDPGETGLVVGDKVDINQLRPHLEQGALEVPIARAEGKLLAKGVGSLTPGTYLDANHIQDLKDQGVNSVAVSTSGLKVEPIVPGLQTAKMLDKNWVSKLSYSKLRDTLQDSAATGAESAVHSTDPITSYTFGNEFGEGENGAY